MNFISMGKGSKIGEANINRNIIVTDDPTAVKSFIEMGENAEIVKLDASGNQVLTTEAYKAHLIKEREPLQQELVTFRNQVEKLENDLHKARIKRELLVVDKCIHDYTVGSTFDLRKAIKFLKDCCINIGCGVIAGTLTAI